MISSSGRTSDAIKEIDALLPAGSAAPYNGILTSQKNYRLYAACIDSSDASEKAYESEKTKDLWKNLGIGFLAGFAASILIKH